MRTRSEIAEGLKTNLAKFRSLDHQQQEMLWEALEEGRGNVERLVPSGKWHPMHCGNLRDDRRYRLSRRFKPYEFDSRQAAETVSQERTKVLEEIKEHKAEKAARKRRKERLDEIKAQIAEEKAELEISTSLVIALDFFQRANLCITLFEEIEQSYVPTPPKAPIAPSCIFLTKN